MELTELTRSEATYTKTGNFTFGFLLNFFPSEDNLAVGFIKKLSNEGMSQNTLKFFKRLSQASMDSYSCSECKSQISQFCFLDRINSDGNA